MKLIYFNRVRIVRTYDMSKKTFFPGPFDFYKSFFIDISYFYLYENTLAKSLIQHEIIK